MKTYQQGISMIEVLVTIVVMSFGFLSLASFQMNTLGHLSSSNQHYQATILAQSIGESIKANNAQAADYNNLDTSTFNKDCSSNTCTIAQWDMTFWQKALKDQGLPNVKGTIGIDGDVAKIAITWDGRDQQQEQYNLEVPLL